MRHGDKSPQEGTTLMNGLTATITAGEVRLRPPSPLDGSAWSRLRRDDAQRLAHRIEGLAPTDTHRWGQVNRPADWMVAYATIRERVSLGLAFSWAICLDDRFVGQMELTGITQDAPRAARVGTWVGQSVASLGVASTSLALALDHGFAHGLEVIEAFVDPDNTASLRGVASMGFHRAASGQQLRSRWDAPWPVDPSALLYEISPADLPDGYTSFAELAVTNDRRRNER